MKIKTLVVDDTVVYRKILSEVVSSLDELELVGTAPNGIIALKKLARIETDLVLLDQHMPEMDGVEVLKKIKEQIPKIEVIMLSGISTRSTDTTIKALEMGAVDFIRKPEGNDFAASMKTLVNDVRPVIRLLQMRNVKGKGNVTPIKKKRVESSKKTIARAYAPVPKNFSILAIGVSTGGPDALSRVIPKLPKNLSVPVLIVQHMPPVFTKSLAESLNKKSAITVQEAKEGEILKISNVYIAPGGYHMVIRKEKEHNTIHLTSSPPENSCRPSVDVLFRSVGQVYANKGIMSVIMTGMGNDGLNGVRALKRSGCYSITQAAETCVVYGMPRAVDEAELSDKSIPLDNLANHIADKLHVEKDRIPVNGTC
ncbi:chemotaxis response regulator protein-glutamate methylesterase [Chitinispirillales bacterium ANBcel5]|uniref:protein-glutamate methylesterase/protein-glutamine glutaminase n=1 Tax=Cellulosispirillum alkaliphilum TaxID=3039283 RepID=UPI002A51462D|nr:chemotaxis response regulator protein-glutamate methylesterase [Chitinispirillales bacterium ANBcel5]